MRSKTSAFSRPELEDEDNIPFHDLAFCDPLANIGELEFLKHLAACIQAGT